MMRQHCSARLTLGLTRDELQPQLRGHALAPASIVGRYTPTPTH